MQLSPSSVFPIFAFVWGAIWGSFLNVVIHRLPRGQSLVRPGSACPSCGRPIRWYENVPILSYVFLRGRCRGCKAPISVRYCVVEALTGALSLVLYLKVSSDRVEAAPGQVALVFLFYFAFVCAVIAIAFIDLELALIPDAIAIPTAALGVCAALVLPKSGVFTDFHPQVTWLDSLVGLGVGVGLFAALFWGYRLLTGRVGLGGGDFTMIGMIGAYLGWRSLPFVLFLASTQGIVLALAAVLVERVRGRPGGMLLRGAHRPEFWEEREAGDRTPDTGHRTPDSTDSAAGFGKVGIPFGPFLGLAALEYLFFGELLEQLLFRV